MSNIEKLNINYINKVMPTVYDDSLSYYEVLSKVLYKINEVIEKIGDTNLKEEIDEVKNKIQEIENFKEEFENFKEEFDEVKPEIENSKEEINEVKNKIPTIENKIQTIEKSLNTKCEMKIVHELPDNDNLKNNTIYILDNYDNTYQFYFYIDNELIELSNSNSNSFMNSLTLTNNVSDNLAIS